MEVKIDNNCKIDENGLCTNDEGIENGKICEFNTDKSICQKRDKKCNEYTDTACGNIPKTNNLQCHKFDLNCQEVQLDAYCHVDDSNECVEKQEGKLTKNEICAFTDYTKTKCQKREKLCSDLIDDSCDNYNPITKFCFKFEGLSSCKEVKIDDSCQMNSSNNCVAKGSLAKNEVCTLDDKKDKCYKKKIEDAASLLSIKLFSLLLLFFIC